MPVKRQSARSKSSRTSKKQRRADYRKITASAGGAARELIRADMKNKKRASHAPRKFSANGAVRKNGATKRSASASVFKHPKTELEAVIQRYVDLTERKRGEEAIRQSEQRYRTLFNLGPMAVYTIDTSGVIRDFNRHAAELWGREPALGDTDQRFCGSFKMFRPDGSFMPHDQCPMAEVAERQDIRRLVTRKCSLSGPTARMSPSLSISVR